MRLRIIVELYVLEDVGKSSVWLVVEAKKDKERIPYDLNPNAREILRGQELALSQAFAKQLEEVMRQLGVDVVVENTSDF